ncbi:hypothetical protein PG987_012453 [Apiospora arundinis]
MDNCDILPEHKERPQAQRGLGKAMNWWIDRVSKRVNTKPGLQSGSSNEEAAFRALNRLASHHRVQIALRPFLVFRHAHRTQDHPSWNGYGENKLAMLKARKEKFEMAVDEVAPNRHGYGFW